MLNGGLDFVIICIYGAFYFSILIPIGVILLYCRSLVSAKFIVATLIVYVITLLAVTTYTFKTLI